MGGEPWGTQEGIHFTSPWIKAAVEDSPLLCQNFWSLQNVSSGDLCTGIILELATKEVKRNGSHFFIYFVLYGNCMCNINIKLKAATPTPRRMLQKRRSGGFLDEIQVVEYFSQVLDNVRSLHQVHLSDQSIGLFNPKTTATTINRQQQQQH